MTRVRGVGIAAIWVVAVCWTILVLITEPPAVDGSNAYSYAPAASEAAFWLASGAFLLVLASCRSALFAGSDLRPRLPLVSPTLGLLLASAFWQSAVIADLHRIPGLDWILLCHPQQADRALQGFPFWWLLPTAVFALAIAALRLWSDRRLTSPVVLSGSLLVSTALSYGLAGATCTREFVNWAI